MTSGEQVLGVLRDAVAVVLEVDPGSVSRDLRFTEDLGADSLAMVEILEITEAQLAALAPTFRIDDADVDAIITVGNFVDYALSRVRGGGA